MLKSCHVDKTSGHMGITRTQHRIKERFMWPGVTEDVKKMVTINLTLRSILDSRVPANYTNLREGQDRAIPRWITVLGVARQKPLIFWYWDSTVNDALKKMNWQNKVFNL